MQPRTDELFADCEFPTTTVELCAAVSGRTVEVAGSRQPAAAAIERGGGDAFETREDAALALRSGLGGDAVGRREYSDRDPTALGEEGPRPVSF
jgi:hypothetical protein